MGGDSQIAVELDLLSAAVNSGAFDYYHLIYGQDLPLKDQDYIPNFLENNTGKNYIEFDPNAEQKHYAEERFQRYHFLENAIGRNSVHLIRWLRGAEKVSLSIQKSLNVNRIAKYPGKIYKGTNWFSITQDMADHVISRKKYIKK